MSGPRGYCATCNNTGEIDCYCGGDLCVCDNNGTMPCPECDGGMGISDDFDEEDDQHDPPPRRARGLAEAVKEGDTE